MKKTLKKAFRYLIAAALCIGITGNVRADAEPDYTDTSYWNNKCTGKTQMTQDEKTACTAYAKYLASENETLSARLDEVEALRDQYEADIAAYKDEIAALNTSIESKQSEIDAKQVEIENKQNEIEDKQGEIEVKIKEIEVKQGEIDETQAEIDSLRQKVMDRMEAAQPTMRLSKYLDILMGAKTFEDFIRIANGFQSITEYDNITLSTLNDLMELLDTQKAELEEAQAELEVQKTELEEEKADLETEEQELEDEQSELLVMKYQAQIAEEAAEAKAAQMEAEGNQIAADIQSANAAINSIAAAGSLNAIVTSAGWTYPVPGAHRSAGTWAYAGGGTHLGYDFAAAIGTNIYAVANGVILYSADNCSTYGYLGSSCGYPGSTGGGNQVYELATVNGSLYAIKYLHMMSGTPAAIGTVVSAGDVIGRVGTSGNSSGGHCHIEIFYLGDASQFSYYAQNWNGDLSFGARWAGENDRRCEDGVGAPCRIRPETIFGY